MSDALLALYPALEPFDAGLLDVGQGHRLYYEQCGHPSGLPVVFLHGGPGSGCTPRQRQVFDPAIFRVVLFDQRGCGRSTTATGLSHNTSAHVVADMEALRLHLGLSRWLVVGGSWGAGLGLAYAAAHPQACLGLLMRSVFLGRRQDVDWFFQGMAPRLPQAWSDLTQGMPEADQAAPLRWLHDQLHHASAPAALQCALRWQAWEASVLRLQRVPAQGGGLTEHHALVAKYQLQSHYLVHDCFWDETEGGLLARVAQVVGLSELPMAVVHGWRDAVCRPSSALELQSRAAHCALVWVPEGGHDPYTPEMLHAFMATLKGFARTGRFAPGTKPSPTGEGPWA
jgi:proline iminopeptidase